jgi:hypothetical protein
MRRNSIFSLIYLVIGFVIALQHGYNVITNLSTLASFLLAVLLWPAILLGLSLHLSLGI